MKKLTQIEVENRMKTIILILLLSIPVSLMAQEKYIIIPEKDAPALKQYKINWHTGIDPVQIKDGTWVLPIKVIDMIPSNIKIIDVAEKEITTDLREYLISKPKKVLTIIDFKEPEIEPKEILKEIIK